MIFWNFDIVTIVFNIASIDQIDRMIERDITQTTKNSITLATLWMIIIENISSSQIRNRINQWSLHLKSSSSTNKISRRIVVALEERSLFWLLSKLHSIRIWNSQFDVHSSRFHDHLDSRFSFDFQLSYYAFALLTVRIYVAWRTESCQKHFQRLSFDLIELRNDNKILRKSKSWWSWRVKK